VSDDASENQKRLSGLRPFKPGQSGNPGGRPKRSVDLRRLARERTVDAIATLINVMRNPRAASAARVSAAAALLDRGWGRPVSPQAFTYADGEDRPTPADIALRSQDDIEVARRVAFLLTRGVQAVQALPAEPSQISQEPAYQDEELEQEPQRVVAGTGDDRA
jgi:hypothetical protein